MIKGTKLFSILKGKCPKCHEGDLFQHSNPYNFNKIFDMPERCPECGQPYELETGFYYGAMYVSYGLGVALMVAVVVAYSVLSPEFDPFWAFVWVAGVLTVLVPPIFRISRSIYINFFVKYDAEAIAKSKQKSH